MGFQNPFRRKKDDSLARLARDRVAEDLIGKTAFTTFFLSRSSNDDIEFHSCPSATHEAAQDQAYERIHELARQEAPGITEYALVHEAGISGKNPSIRSLLVETGHVDEARARVYALYLDKDDSNRILSVSGPMALRRKSENALARRKTVARRAVREGREDVAEYLAGIPLILAYLTLFESGQFQGSLPQSAWNLLSELMDQWIQREGEGLDFMIAAQVHESLERQELNNLLPREGITPETLRSRLHVSSQMMIEGVRAGRLPVEEIQKTARELEDFVRRIAETVDAEAEAESGGLPGLLDYLRRMSQDPLSLSETA